MINPDELLRLREDGYKKGRTEIDRFFEKRSRRWKRRFEEQYKQLLEQRQAELTDLSAAEQDVWMEALTDEALHEVSQQRLGAPRLLGA